MTAAPSFPPIGDIHAHVCGIHFYNGDMSRQVIAEHYCAHLSDEVLECVIYDSDKPGACLIGIEYIVARNDRGFERRQRVILSLSKNRVNWADLHWA